MFTEGGVRVRLDPGVETQPEREPRPPDGPPGQFVSHELQSDTSRFLEEIKDVVRRRREAGLWRGAD
jgi:hypothetical protein